MNNLVEYEWKAEHTDPDGDIQHVDHCGKLTQYFVEQEAEEGTEVIFWVSHPWPVVVVRLLPFLVR